MRLFTSLEFNSLEDLFLEQIGDLYDAEQRLTQALPKMAEAAHSPALKKAFQSHCGKRRAMSRGWSASLSSSAKRRSARRAQP